jgi:4-carboxymuconolactone decarboxylase
MTISEVPRKNHAELFPGHVSTLKVTDPELIEYFENFAFGEVLRYGSLDSKTRLMVQLASMIACQALREYRMMLGAALTAGVTPVEVKEIVYQAVAYVGMAKVFDFIHATNDVLTEREIQLPLEGQSTTTPESRAERGGDNYTRTGIDLRTRELLTFAMLISLGGCEPQAKGHAAANLNVGNDRQLLLAVITQLLPFIGYPRTLNALRVINEVAPA